MTVTIHGINASPDAVVSLSERAAAAGDSVRTFAYDDQHARLRQCARALAADLETWLDANPARPLRIDAHSMGGRIALAALEMLDGRGGLAGRQVELNLVATPISGIAAADYALLAVWPLSAFACVNPGKDMGPSSSYQDALNHLSFPPNVKIRMFTGGRDRIVKSDARFERLCDRLNAQRIRFAVADHDGSVIAAALWLKDTEAEAARAAEGSTLVRLAARL